ncbi:MAG TPA: cell envelope integrity protein CreD [Rhodothermales bacterium]|nr:cell envelope integrity protein CreD [Rhodothermales bacterium]
MSSESSLLERGATWARRSVTLKLFVIGGLCIVLLVPLLMLRGLITERQAMREQAVRSVSASWGQAQTLGGPVLSIPLLQGDSAQTGAVHFLPDRLDIEGTVAPEVRRRGLFRVRLYTATLRVRATFARPDVAGLALGRSRLRPDLATVSLGLPDVRGVQQAIRAQWTPTGGTVQTLEARPGLPGHAPYAAGVHLPVPLAEQDTGYVFETTLVLGGAETLTFLPLGKETNVRLRGDHGPVGFTGAALPRTSTVTDASFSAQWTVLAYNRGFDQRLLAPTTLALGVPGDVRATYAPPPPMRDVTSAPGVPLGMDDTFGVTLRESVDPYQQSMRTAEYGLLFVLLTFATFFFVETLGGRRVHPVQYLLVGFAVCLFYLMLLSFSEYLAFNLAYALAAAAILGLVLLYAKAIFASWRTAGTVTGVLLLFYVYFFVLLQLEEFALLAGSLGLFVILATVMYLSRRVDWYGLGEGRRAEAEDAA